MITFGAELELANVDTTIELPEGNKWDMKDYTIVNDDGTWNDPLKIFNRKGGEVNLKPCKTPQEATDEVFRVLKVLGTDVVNSSTNLHIHIGLSEWDSTTVKKLVHYVYMHQREIFSYLPLPNDLKLKRRKVSNQHMIPTYIYKRIMAADKVTEDMFGNTRFGINVKSLYLHGTVEFRMFGMTTNFDELLNAFKWCYGIVFNSQCAPTAPAVFEEPLPQYTPQTQPLDMSTHLGRHSRLYVAKQIAPVKVAFICKGNVNRSKAAECILKTLDTHGVFEVESFGVRDGTYGKPMHKQTKELLRRHGYDVYDTGSKKLPHGYDVYDTGSKKLPHGYDGYIIDLRHLTDPGYTRDLHYQAFVEVEAEVRKFYRRALDEEPKQVCKDKHE